MAEGLLLLAMLSATTPVTVQVDGGPGAAVRLEAQGGAAGPWFASANDAGVATFPNVEVAPGASYVASAVVGTATHRSSPTALSPGVPATIKIQVAERPSTDDPQSIRVARVFTRVALWEEQVEIHQGWTFVNRGEDTFRPAEGGGLTIRLPEGAISVKVVGLRDDLYEAAGTKVLYKGSVPPGPAGAVEVRLSFSLEYEGPSVVVEQPVAYAVDELMTIVPEVPTVRHTRRDDLRLTIGAHNHATLESAHEGQEPVWVLSGSPSGQAIRFEVAGLPHHSRKPAWFAVILGAALIGWGLLRILGKAGGEAPRQAPAPALDASELAHLRERRRELMDKLVELERSRPAEGPEEAEFRRRRDAMKRRLIDVDRRLEAAS